MSRLVRIHDNLVVDKEFFDFITNCNHIICRILIYGTINDDCDINYISTSNKVDMISYLPNSKVKDGVDPFESTSRVIMRVGRLVSKIIPKHYYTSQGINDSTIEEFVNMYKSWFDRDNYTFKVVDGDEIAYWYNADNYSTPTVGTLWNSCMRYEDRLKYLDLYPKNGVKMLILLNSSNKLRGRALLWDKVSVSNSSTTELPSEIKVMDRIYTIFDSDVNLFKRWAEDNGYVPKWHQNSKSHQIFDVKGVPVVANCSLKLDNFNLKYYPYLDTFPFFNKSGGVLYNSEFNIWDYKLVQANGALEREHHDEDEFHEDEFVDEDF